MTALSAWFYRKMAIWSSLMKRDGMALEYWRKVRALRPRDASVPATIAHIKAGAGQRSEAIGLLNESLELDPGNAATWFNLAFLQQEEGDHEAALRSFDRAIAIDPKLDRAHYGKALSLIKLGRVQDAIDPLKKNTELQPMSPYGWYQLAHAYHRLGDAARTGRTIRKLAEFEPKVARQLERETGIVVGVKTQF